MDNMNLFAKPNYSNAIDNLLAMDGLSLEVLEILSYESQLGINLKKNLHYFPKAELIKELEQISLYWFDSHDILGEINIDYRIKSISSIELKYNRYYPDHQAGKVFNDLLGFRSICSDYEALRVLQNAEHFKYVDMTNGKAVDDGYRGIHFYYQKSNKHYPIEIQYNTHFDRQFNDWLHKYIYKRDISANIGLMLRCLYEQGKIKTESDFREELRCVI